MKLKDLINIIPSEMLYKVWYKSHTYYKNDDEVQMLLDKEVWFIDIDYTIEEWGINAYGDTFISKSPTAYFVINLKD